MATVLEMISDPSVFDGTPIAELKYVIDAVRAANQYCPDRVDLVFSIRGGGRSGDPQRDQILRPVREAAD